MLHGIKRDSQVREGYGERGGIKRITIRYKDGRTFTVVPDAGRKNFAEDDVKELKKIFDKAASYLEWAEVSTRDTM